MITPKELLTLPHATRTSINTYCIGLIGNKKPKSVLVDFSQVTTYDQMVPKRQRPNVIDFAIQLVVRVLEYSCFIDTCFLTVDTYYHYTKNNSLLIA